jgi:hypothetical protein
VQCYPEKEVYARSVGEVQKVGGVHERVTQLAVAERAAEKPITQKVFLRAAAGAGGAGRAALMTSGLGMWR